MQEKTEKQPKSWHWHVGPYAYLLGIIVAILTTFALLPQAASIPLLAFLGIVVGLLNVSDHELERFMLGSLTFLFCAVSFNELTQFIPFVGEQARLILYYLTAFAAPAAAVVALKIIHEAGRK